ncbi:hypothetical protein [Bifidobacterium pseudolongum]|uniref:hypothetical protein n=1 Tax=Bifidobacterium pseudolongum TaxID=1694 RepID=UPI00050559DB|nr:hypothetical protein [Bifidobacterium pseudolongum]KFI79430.1 Dihydroneopterin aldolase [Bifidobacterium pseudolongum subsp. pseudolongum]UNP91778.1 diguanylate cyclase [Bifidobacterium pseudolongum subsp. pseudolongum]WCA40500.1 diguanylate cyclase [Bifidobacterium pseudolongum subsp. pseudolongum]
METNSLALRGVRVEHTRVAQMPGERTVHVDVSCTQPQRATPIDELLGAVEACVQQESGEPAAHIAHAVAVRVAQIAESADVHVTLRVAGEGGTPAYAAAEWSVHMTDADVQPTDDATLPVCTASHAAVISLESRVPNAADVFRTMIVALDGIPGNQVEGISPLYAVNHADGTAGRSAVVALQTTMSAAQLERALTALHAAHEGAVTCHIVQMGGIGDEERAALDTGDAQHRAAVLAPWMDMDPQATLQGDPLAFLLASAPDAPFVGMESDHWIIGGE